MSSKIESGIDQLWADRYFSAEGSHHEGQRVAEVCHLIPIVKLEEDTYWLVQELNSYKLRQIVHAGDYLVVLKGTQEELTCINLNNRFHSRFPFLHDTSGPHAEGADCIWA